MTINVTDKAIESIEKLKKEYSENFSGLRFGYTDGGCSGNKYIIEFDNKNDDDIVYSKKYNDFEIDIYVSKHHISKLINSTIDWKESLMESGFEIINPQAKQPCGCGESVNFS